jgi:predicted RND superfamily exporter protein
MALADDIRDIRADDGKTYHAVSSSVIFADVLTVMLKDSPVAVAVSFAAVFLLVLIDFRSIRNSLVAMIPLICGIAIMLGVMGAAGVHLNFFNMIVLPIILGMGVDCGVHVFHRFQEEGYGNIPKVLTTTGGSIVITTLTTIAGFSGVIFAHHGGLSSMGIAAVIGLCSILVINLFFFPSVLAVLWHSGDDGKPSAESKTT